jgi:hypothetical protein
MKRKPWFYFLAWIPTLPLDAVTFLVVLVVRVLWGNRLEWKDGLWTELRPYSWPSRTWYRYKGKDGYQRNPEELRGFLGEWQTWGGTCLGHGGFFGPGRSGGPGIDTPVEFHENIHVEQAEISMMTAFLAAVLILIGSQFLPIWFACFLGWVSGAILKAVSGWLVAVLRGGDPYWESMHERAAYAITEKEWKDEK